MLKVRAFASWEPSPERLELTGTRFIIEVETWGRTDAREDLIGRPVVDVESFGARLLLLKKPLDKSALGEPVELSAITEVPLSTGVVGDIGVALVEIEWEGAKIETLTTGARDDVDIFPLEVEIRNSEGLLVGDSVKIEVLWTDCTGSWGSALVEVCVGNVVRERREVDLAIVSKELELITPCEEIDVLECVSANGIVVLLG